MPTGIGANEKALRHIQQNRQVWVGMNIVKFLSPVSSHERTCGSGSTMVGYHERGEMDEAFERRWGIENLYAATNGAPHASIPIRTRFPVSRSADVSQRTVKKLRALNPD